MHLPHFGGGGHEQAPPVESPKQNVPPILDNSGPASVPTAQEVYGAIQSNRDQLPQVTGGADIQANQPPAIAQLDSADPGLPQNNFETSAGFNTPGANGATPTEQQKPMSDAPVDAFGTPVFETHTPATDSFVSEKTVNNQPNAQSIEVIPGKQEGADSHTATDTLQAEATVGSQDRLVGDYAVPSLSSDSIQKPEEQIDSLVKTEFKGELPESVQEIRDNVQRDLQAKRQEKDSLLAENAQRMEKVAKIEKDIVDLEAIDKNLEDERLAKILEYKATMKLKEDDEVESDDKNLHRIDSQDDSTDGQSDSANTAA